MNEVNQWDLVAKLHGAIVDVLAVEFKDKLSRQCIAEVVDEWEDRNNRWVIDVDDVLGDIVENVVSKEDKGGW